LLLDDGFQNSTLHQDLGLLVIDGAYGLGNGRVIPAGPLREPAAIGMARAQALVIVGTDRTGLQPGGKPRLAARLVAHDAADLKGRKLVALAGIGRPEKFFATLRELGASLVATHPFADHHPYRDAELTQLAEAARVAEALLVTTEKDRVRLSPAWRKRIRALSVAIEWEDRAALIRVLAPVLSATHG
jgi:tetraacyldisaccharide 4'-kinase